MNEKRYEKKYDIQQKVISRQSKQIEELKLQNEKLKLEIEKKDNIINSVEPMRNELAQNIDELKVYKKQYKELIDEIRNMKEILNKEVYKGRWWLIKFLIK